LARFGKIKIKIYLYSWLPIRNYHKKSDNLNLFFLQNKSGELGIFFVFSLEKAFAYFKIFFFQVEIWQNFTPKKNVKALTSVVGARSSPHNRARINQHCTGK
jgi:hypothetical protein